MPKWIKYSLLISLFKFNMSFSQNPQLNNTGIRLMFYNVENLFHPDNDSLKNDDEFTKEGIRYWSYYRYQIKLNQIAQNIIAIGEWEPPAIVGLCEIENLTCLKDLIYNTPLKAYGYKIIHQESKDKRGIDVALLYREEYFNLISFKAFELKFPKDSRPSRDILYVKGKIKNDTLHCFVNHWPSRYGGQLATTPKREFAAKVLKSKFDSIQKNNPFTNIIAMGDFNDYPSNNSMYNILKAKKETDSLKKYDLINLLWPFTAKQGTNKYKHEWHILDQFIINQNLNIQSKTLYSPSHFVNIFKPNWLMTDENDGFGKKPFRTYNGYKYIGGYSDHLPIYTDIIMVD